MRKSLSVSILITVLAAGAALAAKPQAAGAGQALVSMRATGTFDAGSPALKIALFCAPDEAEPASFVMTAKKPISGVSVKLAGDLSSGKNKIAASRVRISPVEGDRLEAMAPLDLSSTAKRFWITFDVPAKTPAGTYQGTVVATAGGKVIGKLPMELTVLPMRLLRSCKQYGFIMPPAETIDGDCKQMLVDIRKLGFGLAGTSVPPEALEDSITAIKEAGLGSTVPYTYSGITAESISGLAEQAKQSEPTRLLCGVAFEPRTSDQLEAAAANIEAAKKARLKSFAVLSDEAAFDLLANSLDAADYRIDLPYIRSLLSGEKRANGRHEWWYWDISADARANRANAGFLLWKSGLDGAFPPLVVTSNDPAAAAPRTSIGTIQCEALREGIDDTRYLTTMMAALREVKDALKVGGTKNATAAQKTVEDTEAFLSAMLAKPLGELKNSDYQAMRKQAGRYTIKLRQILK